MSLQCPKCHNVMRQYERNGVILDQCTECKGLFLDRGELEKLVAAESSWYGGAPSYGRPDHEPRYEESRYESRREPRYERHDDDDDHRYRHDDDDHRYRHDDDHHQYRKKDRRRSFLEQLFD